MGRRPKELSPRYVVFEATTIDALNFLITDYGFRHIRTWDAIVECGIQYRNETTSVVIECEAGSTPDVFIGRLTRLKRKPRSLVEAEHIGLDILIDERCHERGGTKEYDFSDTDTTKPEATDEKIERVVRNYASILKEHGHDILTGDFSVFPQLKKRTRKLERKWNKALYGSETGETP